MRTTNSVWWMSAMAGLATGLPAMAEHRLHPSSDPAPIRFEARADDPAVSDLQDGWRVKGKATKSGEPLRVRLVPAEDDWDCREKLWLLVDVTNQGEQPLLVTGKARSADSPYWVFSQGGMEVPAGATGTVPILIARQVAAEDTRRLVDALGTLKGYPGGHQGTDWLQIDASAIHELELTFLTDASRVHCRLSNLRGSVNFSLPTAEQLRTIFSPVTDRFGQSSAETWPSKVTAASSLTSRAKQEDAWLQTRRSPRGWNRYGGWSEGMNVGATGHFRTLKEDGRWWLVDSDGDLFWSLGVTSFSYAHGGTEIRDVGEALSRTPADEPPVEALPGLGTERWNPYLANLFRKFGPDWRARSAAFAHRRLRAWGINTMGNWSTPEFTALGKTPYVVAVHYMRPTLEGRKAKWGEALPDVFHPAYRERTLAGVRAHRATAKDPWCIGYFIDNELGFPNPSSPGTVALAAPADCYTRQELIGQLQAKYATVDALNRAWRTRFAEWSGLSPVPGKTARGYREDMEAFSELYLRRYFSICRDAVREVAPGKLYLGCRINHVGNQTALALCAEYADVVSINLYRYSPAVLELPDGFDAPILIGEFHLGTITERGVWGAGLTSATDLNHAADLFQIYLRDALTHPQIVGAHWFTYADQPLPGRDDGENHRIGFVDVTDTPYPEMVNAARRVAGEMYPRRAGSRGASSSTTHPRKEE